MAMFATFLKVSSLPGSTRMPFMEKPAICFSTTAGAATQARGRASLARGEDNTAEDVRFMARVEEEPAVARSCTRDVIAPPDFRSHRVVRRDGKRNKPDSRA